MTPSLEIWVRTAGGAGNSLDRDGDGLSDAEEALAGSDPDSADTDGDGLLDNVDVRPTIADNVVVATLSDDSVTLAEGGPLDTGLTLNLDSGAFPFFEWTLSSNAAWLTLDVDSGFGDATIGLRINTSALTSSDSPYRAAISVDAPAMAPVSPVVFTLLIEGNQVDLLLNPDMLAFTVVEGGDSTSKMISIGSPDGDDFTWRVNETPPWISVSPESGDGPSDIVIAVDPGALLAGESPYSATVTFVPDGVGPKQATVDVTASVFSSRDLNEPFPLFPSDDAQTRPAIAFDSTRNLWLLSWVEDGQVRAMFFDENLLPRRSPVQVSISALGMATNPAVLFVDEAQEAWVVWEQRATPTSDGLIQARFFDLADLSLGSGFGFTTGAGDKSVPAMAYNRAANEVLITYSRDFNDTSFVGFARLDGTSREESSTTFVALNDNHQSNPTVAWLPDANAYLIVWLEIVGGIDDTREHP
ncbi:MAG: hypothetical protein L3K26_00680, partial [Candidatus Hydrogenedentes bacterium]|nr:hypothetical protein [Candidatus Hydrogenedentota bacterium]